MNNTDEFECEENNNENEFGKTSRLEPSGFTETNKALHEFAGKLVKEAKEIFKLEPVMAKVWSYRYGGYSMISCDLFSVGHKINMPITISAVNQQMLECQDEPDVFDMAEAIHLVGIITQALDAKISIGLGRNEVSPLVLESPLKENHTNGKINLWKNSELI